MPLALGLELKVEPVAFGGQLLRCRVSAASAAMAATTSKPNSVRPAVVSPAITAVVEARRPARTVKDAGREVYTHGR